MTSRFALATVDRYWLIGGDEDGTKHHIDVRFLDRVLAAEPDELVLAVGDVHARFATTARTAVDLATQLMPYTRAAPLTQPDAYADAKRRLALAARGKTDNGALFVFLRTHDVFASGDHVCVGERKFRRVDIELYATARTRLPIKHMGLLDCGLAMLTVGARERVEDLVQLAAHVAAYEQRERMA